MRTFSTVVQVAQMCELMLRVNFYQKSNIYESESKKLLFSLTFNGLKVIVCVNTDAVDSRFLERRIAPEVYLLRVFFVTNEITSRHKKFSNLSK